MCGDDIGDFGRSNEMVGIRRLTLATIIGREVKVGTRPGGAS